MPMDVEAEIRDLKRRVGELEGSSGFLTKQVQGVHKVLLRFEEKTNRKLREHDRRFDQIETGLGGRIEKVETEVRGLRRDLPKIVGDAMREANREGRGRKR
jgi:hypothetical protein